jgi:hypothetical protein
MDARERDKGSWNLKDREEKEREGKRKEDQPLFVVVGKEEEWEAEGRGEGLVHRK